MSSLRRRFGKPTTAGYVVLGIIVVLVVTVVVGVIIGGDTGRTIDTVAAVLIVVFIFLMFGAMTPRRRGDDPRDHFDRPPGPNEYR
jgi:Kef-type K+ transport system membrane component KefB